MNLITRFSLGQWLLADNNRANGEKTDSTSTAPLRGRVLPSPLRIVTTYPSLFTGIVNMSGLIRKLFPYCLGEFLQREQQEDAVAVTRALKVYVDDRGESV